MVSTHSSLVGVLIESLRWGLAVYGRSELGLRLVRLGPSWSALDWPGAETESFRFKGVSRPDRPSCVAFLERVLKAIRGRLPPKTWTPSAKRRLRTR